MSLTFALNYLGIILAFKEHLINCPKKHLLPYTMLLCILIYCTCNNILNCTSAKNLTKISKLQQQKALRIVTKSKINSHTAPLFKDLKILPLKNFPNRVNFCSCIQNVINMALNHLKMYLFATMTEILIITSGIMMNFLNLWLEIELNSLKDFPCTHSPKHGTLWVI